MGRAQKRDASASSKFYFRKDVFSAVQSGTSSVTSSSGDSTPSEESPRKKEKKMGNCFPPPPLPQHGIYRLPVDEEYDEFTMDEIMNGKVSWSIVVNFLAKNCDQGETFPGLLPLVDAYLDTLEIDINDMKRIQGYLELVRRRSNGMCHSSYFSYDPG